jgi:hypothetical protein
MNVSGGNEAWSQMQLESCAELPESRLMLAVLEEALTTYRLGLESDSPQRRQRFFEVARWFADRDGSGLFSFECICATLGIDADYFRAGLRRLGRSARRARTAALHGSRFAPTSVVPRVYRTRA